jgi:hypothetical protein
MSAGRLTPARTISEANVSKSMRMGELNPGGPAMVTEQGT